MTWVETALSLLGRPPLEQLRALQQLRADPALTVEQVITDTAREIAVDESHARELPALLADVLARVLPETSWMPLLAALAEAELTHERMTICDALPRVLGARLVGPAIAALDTMPAFALRRLDTLWHEERSVEDALAEAWPNVLALVEHEDPAIAIPAAFLAIRGPAITPSVVSVLARSLAAQIDELDPYAYDDQLSAEEALGAIAIAGRRHAALRELAPSFVPFLRCETRAWRTSATEAAIGTGARELCGEIEEALKRAPGSTSDLGAQVERAVHLYATWLFGAPRSALADAVAAAGDSIVVIFRLRQAFVASPVDDRLLEALRGVADDPVWTATICDVFAELGSCAASTLSTVAAPAVDDEAYTPWVAARYRCGLATRHETRVALEAKLAWRAWDLYVELAADDPIAEQTLRDALSTHASEHEVPFAGPLAGSPVVLARLVPELVRGGHDRLLVAAARAGISLG